MTYEKNYLKKQPVFSVNLFYIFGASFLPIGMLAVTTTEDGCLTVVGDVVVVFAVVVVVIDANVIDVVESVVEGTGFAGTAGANGLSAIGLLLSIVGLFTGANPISISDPVDAPALVLVLLVSLEDSLLAPVDPVLAPLLDPVDPMLAPLLDPVDDPVLAPLLDPAVDPVLTVVESVVVAGTAAGAASSFLSVDSSMELMTSGNLQQLPK